MKFILATYCFLIFGFYSLIAQKTKTIYLNQFWEESSKKESEYYRKIMLRPEKDNLFTVEDYYLDGTPASKGFFSDTTNYVKVGLWKGYFVDGKLQYEEEYLNGELLKGISFDKFGKKYRYKVLSVQPEPRGGMSQFYKFIGERLNYPNEARRKGIQGKVFVLFVVDKGGRITDVEAVKGIGAGCDREAVRVVRSSPMWKPGRQRGQIVDVRMILPLTFKLG